MDAVTEIRKRTGKDDRIAFVYGNFNILHPGHLRLLKFAKESGDFLAVGVKKRDANIALLDENMRLENLKLSTFVDFAFILEEDPVQFIGKLKPEIVIKGKEHENSYNPEEEIINEYGGRLLFNSGNIRFSSFDLLKDDFYNLETSTIRKPEDFMIRHEISKDDLRKTVSAFSELNVVVIGDLIVDEYITCHPLGMSQEDPTIVVTPISNDRFLGGAGIVAAHAAGLGASVTFATVAGDDENLDFADQKLSEYNANALILRDEQRPTILKQRFRANGKTLLRVNHLKEHNIGRKLQDNLFEQILPELIKANLVIFADFNYGCLPQPLIDKIHDLCIKNRIQMVADSQSSSQMGDISRFKDMLLITPTEREARLALRDFESGLIVLAEKLEAQTNTRNIFTTLNSEGTLIYNGFEKQKKWQTDKLPAMNKAPKDVSGAGDSLLTCSALALVSGADIWQSAFLGSLAAACQVGRVGNIPLQRQEIIDEINL